MLYEMNIQIIEFISIFTLLLNSDGIFFLFPEWKKGSNTM